MEERKDSLLTLNLNQIKSLRDIVIESLREAIIAGELKPGERLKERELAEKMGISTTPVKEALRILTHEGLVITLPRKGTIVSELVDTSIEEVLMLKASLEGLAANLAAKKISEKDLDRLRKQIKVMEQLAKQKDREELKKENTVFHTMIRDAAQNPVIQNTLKTVISFDKAFRARALKLNIEIREGFAEHKQIFEAIEARDSELAEKRMKDHINRTRENVMSHLNK
ncbi:GntR family transcriptional regulator [Pseudalkalibacillus sp. A8]|uniref:GntR family transcriptional regulator n=1 Tax=Pseudalkalibacillus sp. A8 TaxID=3382641 RepID=UPI0038B4B4E8